MRFVALLAALAAALPAAAQTATWNSVTGTWSTAANWTPAAVPVGGPTRELVFLGDGYTSTQNVNTAGATAAATYQLNRLTVNSTGTVTLTGAATGNTLTFAGTTPTIDVQAGTMAFTGLFANSPEVTKTGAGTFVHDSNNAAFTGTLRVNGGTFVNRATLTATTNFNPVLIEVNNGGTYQFGELQAGDPNLPNTTYVTVNPGGVVEWQEGETFGGFNLQGGTIRFNTGGVTTAGTSNQQWTAGLLTTTGGVAYAVGGTTPIDKTTAGTVTVNALASVAPVINIQAGTIAFATSSNFTSNANALTLGAAATAGTLEYQGATFANARPVAVNAGGGTVRVTDPAAALTLSGPVTGGGTLTKDGTGTVILTSTNTTGGAAVSGGTLQLGAGGATGSIAGPVGIAAGATLAVNRSDNFTLPNALSGAGGLTKLGANTLTLGGAVGYTGPTVVSAGTLRLPAPLALGGPVTVADAATLAVASPTGSAGLTVPALALGGAAGSTLRFELAAAGNPTVAPLTVTGSNALTTAGGTQTLAVAAAQSLAVGQFALVDYAGSPITAGFALAPLPARTVGTLVYNQANTSLDLSVTAVDSIVWRGNLSADWDVGTAVGSGGTNNWVLASNPGSATNFVQGDTVRFDDTGASLTVNLTTVVQPSGLTVAGAAGYTFQGTGSVAGDAGLVKTGTGTLTVLTSNTNTGTTSIGAGGQVVVGNGGTTGALGTGDLTIDGGLTVNRSDALTIPGNLSGAGTLTKQGANTLTLTGVVGHTGQTAVNGGTLALDTPAVYTLPSSVTGAGGLAKLGGGTVVLTGSNTFAGGTAVTAGTLAVGAGGTAGSLTGTVDVAAGAALRFDRSDAVTFNGALTGAGALVKQGAGPLTLTGANTLSGPTTVAAGILQFGNGGATGLVAGAVTVAAGATATLNVSADVAITGASALAGPGTFVKAGTNTLTLTGNNNSFTGSLFVNAGAVVLDDTTALGGTGGGDLSASSIVVNNGGLFRFASGNPDFPDTTVITVNAGGAFELNTGENYGGLNLLGGTYRATAAQNSNLVVNSSWTGGTASSLTAGTTAAIAGAALITKTTAATVTLTDIVLSNTGGLDIQQGTVETNAGITGATGAIGFGSATTAGVLRLTDANTAAVTTISRPLAVAASGGTIDVATAGKTFVFSGAGSGTGTLTKAGAGTLASATTLTGSLAVAAGTLRPGTAVATPALTVGGDLSLAAGAALRVNLFGPALADTSRVSVTGTASVAGAALLQLDASALTQTDVDAVRAGGPRTYTVVQAAAVTGGFGGLDVAGSNFGLFTSNEFSLAGSPAAGTVQLLFTPVPEPGLLLVVAAGGLLVRRRRR